MKYILFFSLLLSLNAHEVLWSDKLVSLIEEDGFTAITLNRAAPLNELTDEEKIAMERTVGKMQTVFQRVFGFGDFARWMPLQEEKLTSYLLPSGAYSHPDEVNYDFKIRMVLFCLKDQKGGLSPLSAEQISSIQSAAREILPYPQPSIALTEGSFRCTQIVQGLAIALQELGQSPELQEEPPPYIIPFTTKCRAFCNPQILQKQHVFNSDYNHLLYNHRPYVPCHLMIVPTRHISTLSENTDEEILDRFVLIAKVSHIALTELKCPKVGVSTRIGWRGGQTQSHLHDHIFGYDPNGEQSWLFNWVSELKGTLIQVEPVQWEAARTYWETKFSTTR